jgi:cytochrome d ubiquinol oxidase subunit II
MGIDLPVIWFVIIVFGLMMYIVMDGFDLGIGILFPFVRHRDDRDAMVNSVAPVWDGNETWLVLGGAGLMAAFPRAYAIVLTGLYLPLAMMLIGLIWRGVAFEFRFKAAERHRPLWDKAFASGSYTATFFQGVTLGAFVDGIEVRDGQFAGSAFDWVSPFSLFTGVALIVAYALLGSTWLLLKSEGDLRARMQTLARPATLLLVAAIIAVSLWTPLAHAPIAERWFTRPNLYYFAPVPLLVGVAAFALLRALREPRHDAIPFVLALCLIFLGYSGLGISLWPYIVPYALTIRAGAGPPQSLGFALVGALMIIPIILMYTAWSYYVFRGKVRRGEGYH